MLRSASPPPWLLLACKPSREQTYNTSRGTYSHEQNTPPQDDLQRFITGVVAEGPAGSGTHDEGAVANFLSGVLGPDSASDLQPSHACVSDGTASDDDDGTADAESAAAAEAALPASPVDAEMPSPQGRRVAPAALQQPPSPQGMRCAHSPAAASAVAAACSSPTAGGGPCSPPRCSPRACSPAGHSEFSCNGVIGGGGGGGGSNNLVAGKVKVFVSMHGDPLLKSMLMPSDIEFEEFVRRIERKLDTQDLRIYYHEGGDKVEVDDDDSVACFFAMVAHDAKMRLSVFPAEIISARPARSFMPAGDAASASLLQQRTLSASALRRGSLGHGYGSASGFGMGRRASSYSRGGWQSTLGGVECARSAGQLAGCYGGR